MTDCLEPSPSTLSIVEPPQLDLGISGTPVLQIQGHPQAPQPIAAPQTITPTSPKIRLVVRPKIVSAAPASKSIKLQIPRNRLAAIEFSPITNPTPVEVFRPTISLECQKMNSRQQKYYDVLVKLAVERGYQVLGTYVNTTTKIQMQCPENHLIQIAPDHFKSGTGCARCAGNCPIQGKEDLDSQAANRGYRVLGTYVDNRTTIQMQCPENHLIEIKPNNFKSGYGCAKCAGLCSIQSKEDFDLQATERGYRILGSYVNVDTKIQMQCPENHLIEITPKGFKNGQGCARCAGLCPIQAKEDFNSQAVERGYQVLGSYVNVHTKIQMQCPQNHPIEITPSSFKSGNGCARCAENCPIQAKEDFDSQAAERGYQILETYVNSSTKIQMRCPENHLIEVIPSDFKRGTGCARCAGNCPIQGKEALGLQAAERGYRVLGTYVDNRTKIQMWCPKNHQFEISPNGFKNGQGCAKCVKKCPIQAREDFDLQAVERGYRILGSYVNVGTKIQMQCPQNHRIEITPSSFKSGQGCARCALKCPIQSREEFDLQAVERGYRILGSYVNVHTKIQMQCPQNHPIEITPSSFKSGHGCARCGMGWSGYSERSEALESVNVQNI